MFLVIIDLSMLSDFVYLVSPWIFELLFDNLVRPIEFWLDLFVRFLVSKVPCLDADLDKSG